MASFTYLDDEEPSAGFTYIDDEEDDMSASEAMWFAGKL